MCGRYASTRRPTDLAHLYAADGTLTEDLGAQYNVAPTTNVYAILERQAKGSGDVERFLRAVRWGLVPSWARDVKIGGRLINARVETIAEKPSWRSAYRRRRAVLPADGYYEWMAETGTDGKPIKQPYYLHGASSEPLSFAALYELWPDPLRGEDDPDRWLWSAAIITCAAEGPAGEIHDRTPVILPRDRVDAWLDPARTHPDAIGEVLAGIHPPILGIRAVSREVNRVGTNGPQLIAPLAGQTDAEIQLRLAS